MSKSSAVLIAMIVIGVEVMALTPVRGDTIDLVLSPSSQTVTLGSTVAVDLYAVSPDVTPDEISVMEVILGWDQSVLTLVGNTDIASGYTWLSSNFPATGDFGLNSSFADGDALYVARSQFSPNPSAFATPSPGLLVTTLLFTADALSAGTLVDIPSDDSGSGAETTVIGDTPNFNVFGTSSGALITVVIPEPANLGLMLVGVGLLGTRRAGR